jgi:alpha-glucosidase (family GH31 glycosyl hydrolase)
MYTYAYQADRTGTPLVRAMTLEFPNDPHLKGEKYKYQYMYGKSLLVAPVYESMEDSKGWRKNIYLPKGTWIDFWDGTRTSAPQGGMVLARYPVTIDKIPVLVKAGAIIPMYQGARSDALQPKDNLIVQLYPHGNSSFTLYEDDGETRAYKHKKAYAETLITATAPLNNETGDINLTINPAIVHHDYDGLVTERKYHFQVLSLVKPLDVTLNSKKVNKANSMADFEAATDAWFYDPTDRKGVIHVKTGKQSVYQYQNLTINIAKNATPTP